MTYKTLTYIHSLLVQEAGARAEKMEEAKYVYNRAICEDGNFKSAGDSFDSSRKSYFEVQDALEDFVNADWHC